MADDYPLEIIAGERYARGFRYKPAGVAEDLTGYTWKAQVRQKESVLSKLLLDLTPYITLNGTDETLLDFELSALVTAEITKLPTTAAWDIFLWPTSSPADAIRLLQGPATLDPAATDTRA